ncbi:MAG: helix-turn-helix domain-containing protein [Kiritimatiellae bacterium]|nr:helix-turn-helix domain-containing protein [Kiritimatiellia bacterium]
MSTGNKSPITPTQLDLFESDITLGTTKVMYRPDEVASILTISLSQVYNLIDTGELEGVAVNSAVDPQPERVHRRVTVRSLEAFINRRRKMAI